MVYLISVGVFACGGIVEVEIESVFSIFCLQLLVIVVYNLDIV